MKRILLLSTVVVLLCSCARNTTYNQFHKKNKDDVEFAFGAPGFLVNLFLPKDDFREYRDLLRKARFHKVMVFEDAEGDIADRFSQFVKCNDLSEVFGYAEENTSARIFFKKDKNRIKEVIIGVAEEDNFVLYGLKTKISEEELYASIRKAAAQ